MTFVAARDFRDSKGAPVSRKEMLRIRFEDQGGRCHYCKRLMVPLDNDRSAYNYLNPTIDHLIPACRGGDGGFSNVAAACVKCNAAKGAMTADEFMAVLEKRASKVRMGKKIEYARKVARANVVPVRVLYASNCLATKVSGGLRSKIIGWLLGLLPA